VSTVQPVLMPWATEEIVLEATPVNSKAMTKIYLTLRTALKFVTE